MFFFCSEHAIRWHHFVTRVIFNHPILVLEPEQPEVSYRKYSYILKIVLKQVVKISYVNTVTTYKLSSRRVSACASHLSLFHAEPLFH